MDAAAAVGKDGQVYPAFLLAIFQQAMSAHQAAADAEVRSFGRRRATTLKRSV